MLQCDVQLTNLFIQGGAGMLIDGSTSVIRQCTFTNNYAGSVSTTVQQLLYLIVLL